MEILNLIPGIPDEIAQECLIRVPLDSFPLVRHVCRQWKQEIESNSFHSLRKASGMTQKVVIAAQCEPCIIPASEANNPKLLAPTGPIKYHLAVFYPDSGEWIRLPMIPGIPIGIPLFCHLAPVGHKLVMLGGWNPQSWAATDWVLVFDFMTGAWHRGASIPTPLRSFFACAVHENLVFVAGGHDGEKNATKTAMAYDVSSDKWIPLPNMSIERDEPKGMFLDGKFVVAGGYVTAEQGRFRRSAEMFDPVTWTWGPVLENWLDEDVKATHTCMASNGKCYKLREDRYLVVREDGGWRVVGEIPEDARASTRIADAGNQRIAVVGSTYHAGIPVAYLAIEEAGKGVTWQRMEMPPEFWGHIQGISSMEL